MEIKELYRIATAEEINYYKNRLYPLQDRILKICSHIPDLYLTGGTALSRFYFQHRLSDDIDLFININKNDSIDIIKNIKSAKIISQQLIRLLDKEFEITNEFFGEYYSRFFLNKDDLEIKIDFVQEYNHYGNFEKTESGILLNNLEDMLGNKISAFEERAEIKDIIDLYYLNKQFTLEQMFEIANVKREVVQYENLLTINLFGIAGKTLLLKDINLNELELFIAKLKYATESEIKKKEIEAEKKLNENIRSYLWDFPPEDRNINKYSIPVLKNRLSKMPLPIRRVIKKAIDF
jgi:hypothetical protein